MLLGLVRRQNLVLLPLSPLKAHRLTSDRKFKKKPKSEASLSRRWRALLLLPLGRTLLCRRSLTVKLSQPPSSRLPAGQEGSPRPLPGVCTLLCWLQSRPLKALGVGAWSPRLAGGLRALACGHQALSHSWGHRNGGRLAQRASAVTGG